MSAYECMMGIVGKDVELAPSLPFMVPNGNGKGQSATLEEVYAASSGQKIALTLNGAALGSAMYDDHGTVDEGVLRDALNQLAPATGNPPLNRLGVIFSNFYTPRMSLFGIMFDTAFEGGRPPRDGCAVFLGSIAKARLPEGGDLDDYFAQVAFTTVHELGHVFNLVHVPPEQCLCFLNTSMEDSNPPPEAYIFDEDQQNWLGRCGSDEQVTPGMSPFRGTDVTSGQDNPKAWTLTVTMSEPEFWSFSPVELKVALTLSRAAKRAVHVPEELDPGYARLKLWIEHPNGERRLYRPTVRYCESRQTRKVMPGETFERDVSIFGQAGGYVFSNPGCYAVWATYEQGRGKRLTSEKIAINVLPCRARGKAPQARLEDMRGLLHHGRRTLYYKSAHLWPLEIASLEELIQRHRGSSAAGAACYALGKALLARSHHARESVQKSLRLRAQQHLARAEKHPKLEDHRKEKAGRLIASMRG